MRRIEVFCGFGGKDVGGAEVMIWAWWSVLALLAEEVVVDLGYFEGDN